MVLGKPLSYLLKETCAVALADAYVGNLCKRRHHHDQNRVHGGG
jgi:hypothetical protein